MKNLLFASVILAFLVQGSGNCVGQDQAIDTRLVDQAFRDPTEDEVQRYRDYLARLDREPADWQRFAYRCNAIILGERRVTERFVSLHAVDRDLEAVRHVARRNFLPVDDRVIALGLPTNKKSLLFHSKNVAFFPERHDRLRIADEFFCGKNESIFVETRKAHESARDRNLNSVTCSLLSLPSYFAGPAARRKVSDLYGIEIVRPEKVAVEGSSFFVKNERRTVDRKPTCSYSLFEFVDGLPVTHEVWSIHSAGRQIRYRTKTDWQKIGTARVPVSIEASELGEGAIDRLEANFDWKFGDGLPPRLFEVSDLVSPDSLNW